MKSNKKTLAPLRLCVRTPRLCAKNSRRGVLLLVILALLAMFALVAVAFVVLTGRALTGAKQIQRIDQHLDQPDQDLERAAMQILRGTNNPASVIGPHSLLEDIYGNGSITGNMASAQGLCGGQLACITPDPANMPTVADRARRTGCVLTMLTGPAVGQSTRVVGYDQANNLFHLLAFEYQTLGAGNVVHVNGTPLTGDYIINGTPFSGTGFGWDTTDGDLDAKDTAGDLYALLPNSAAFQPSGTYTDPAGPGGANEDYDAVDFQNMLLAAQIPLPSGEVATIPSLHRPALVDYWIKEKGGATATWNDLVTNHQDLARKITLRPLEADHSGFDGSNLSFDPAWDGVAAGNRWDVDNDGDGVADSVWVDLGMPARSTPDGRMYKPLFAILCLDMDGRLNLNAHGYLAQAATDYDEPVKPATEIPIPNSDATLAGDPATLPTLPRGQGYGPADINLTPLFTANPTHYENIMIGVTNGFDGRYGSRTDGQPGIATLNDPLSYNQHFDYPADYPDFATPTSYGSPPDMNGMMAVGLDLRGQPLYAMLGGIWDGAHGTGAAVDDPYELNLSQNTSRGLSSPSTAPDNPFSVAELERLLRPFDRDATRLPGRLWALTGGTTISNSVLHDNRHKITTESWSLPCPSVTLPPELRTFGLPKHITDLLAAKNVSSANYRHLFPPELLAGLRMDINRPFGDGEDDAGDTDTVVDNPDEQQTCNEQLTLYDRPGNTTNVDFDHLNDGGAGTLAVRQLHARHLYVLMLLLMNYDTADADEARQVAQWAVNIVDFRDRDSIMTPFEYDIDPFREPTGGTETWETDGNPWDVDGVIGPPSPDDDKDYRGLVWGCERPELLITETLAFHDRRTEDLDTDGKVPPDPDNPAPPNEDEDFDQVWKPEGSLFIELYNPWTTMEPRAGELYDTTHGGVDLTKADGGSPVWRLIIADRHDDSKDPDDPDSMPTFERSVYFVNPMAVTLPADDLCKQFHPEAAQVSRIAPILPGRYMVIGPGEPGDTGTSTTYIGFETGGDPGTPGSSRRIELKPNNNPDTAGQVVVKSDGTNDDLSGVTIQNAVAVVVNSPRRLSISELDGGYAGLYTSDPTNALDLPADQGADPANPRNPLWNGDYVKLKDNRTYIRAKVVHLQRLANPLLAYHSVTNPYRTLDTMAIDLTSFNGVTNDQDTGSAVLETGDDSDMLAHERGDNNDVEGVNNLWRQEPLNDSVPKRNEIGSPSVGPPSTTADHYFGHPIHHTLGYLNYEFFKFTYAYDPGPPPTVTPPKPRMGPGSYEGDPPDLQGDKNGPFPWLTWNNRPFVSQLELLMVPKWRSSQLLQEYGLAAAGAAPYTNVAEPFPHMINFFFDSAAPLCRLLDYLHVPSRFVGTELQANPTNCTTGDHSFHPPFNHISNYRDPGKVNINTIFSVDVWRGLTNYFPDMNTAPPSDWQWDEFVQSRRGYTATTPSNILAMDTVNHYPTRFVRPFRSAAAGDLVPPTTPTMAPTNEIDATLLRSAAVSPTGTSSDPLFGFSSTATAYNNTDRNPFFRYQGIQRLGNLVTTRSNVYAVWITVGYFEVSPAPTGYDPNVHLDGYRLGAELGSDTGDINRHRAFYMFDRSVPVGFQRGKDLNVEKAVLLRRFIE